MTDATKRLQNRRKPSPRAADVARLAGCSTATVSRVQNLPHLVSEATRTRVEQAIRALSYLPNSAARALRSERTRLIGAIIPTLNHAIHAGFAQAAQSRLARDGHSLVVATSEYSLDQEVEQVSRLVSAGVDGLILVGTQHRGEIYELLDAGHVPHINTYVFDADSPHPCVGIDNARGTYDIVAYLHELGHRRFGAISATLGENDRARDRVAGVRAALAERGLSLPPAAIVQRGYTIANGREGFRILRSLPAPPTAILCGNDVLALGALIECREMGLSAPGDVSITGFDNLDFAPHVSPGLTTMAVPAWDMGRKAASYILDTLHNLPTLPKIRLEPSLIVRGSTGPAPRET